MHCEMLLFTVLNYPEIINETNTNPVGKDFKYLTVVRFAVWLVSSRPCAVMAKCNSSSENETTVTY